MVRNEKGFFPINLTTILAVLSLVGIWYLRRAYTSGSIKNDFGSMFSDGKSASDLSNLSPGVQEEISKASDIISNVTGKYKTTSPSLGSKTSSQNLDFQTTHTGGFYGQ